MNLRTLSSSSDMQSWNRLPREAAASSPLMIFGSKKASIVEDMSIEVGGAGLQCQQRTSISHARGNSCVPVGQTLFCAHLPALAIKNPIALIPSVGEHTTQG